MDHESETNTQIKNTVTGTSERNESQKKYSIPTLILTLSIFDVNFPAMILLAKIVSFPADILTHDKKKHHWSSRTVARKSSIEDASAGVLTFW